MGYAPVEGKFEEGIVGKGSGQTSVGRGGRDGSILKECNGGFSWEDTTTMTSFWSMLGSAATKPKNNVRKMILHPNE